MTIIFRIIDEAIKQVGQLKWRVGLSHDTLLFTVMLLSMRSLDRVSVKLICFCTTLPLLTSSEVSIILLLLPTLLKKEKKAWFSVVAQHQKIIIIFFFFQLKSKPESLHKCNEVDWKTLLEVKALYNNCSENKDLLCARSTTPEPGLLFTQSLVNYLPQPSEQDG